jgi:hypothetical protein
MKKGEKASLEKRLQMSNTRLKSHIVNLEGVTKIKCKICLIEKTLDNFTKRKYRLNSYDHRCHGCSAERAKLDSKSPNRKFKDYKSSAKKRNHAWNLTKNEFMNFWKTPCSYCGDNIETIGLDRMDNNLGYNMDNVTACCETCNRGKLQMNKENFLIWIEKIYNKSILKNSGVTIA